MKTFKYKLAGKVVFILQWLLGDKQRFLNVNLNQPLTDQSLTGKCDRGDMQESKYGIICNLNADFRVVPVATDEVNLIEGEPIAEHDPNNQINKTEQAAMH